jgi:nitric oxide reductase large subunit
MYYVILFLLGTICGFGGKLGADWYAEWKAEQKDIQNKMEKWSRTLDAMELLKKQ